MARLKDKLLLHNRKLYVTWNGTMFVDLVWSLNASSLLSASAELHVTRATHASAVFAVVWLAGWLAVGLMPVLCVNGYIS